MYMKSVSSPTLKAWGLTRTFGSGETLTVALRNVGIELYPGQLAMLMGPSGSGKSTLLAVLSGLLQPDEGTGAGPGSRPMGHDANGSARISACVIAASSFRATTCSPP